MNNYQLYLGAYNRNRRAMYRHQRVVRELTKSLKDSKLEEGIRDHLRIEMNTHQQAIGEAQARMHYLESNAERNGFDLRRKR